MPRRLPPPMERTFADDVKWAALVLAGALLAFLVLGADDAGILAGAAVGVVFVVVVLSAMRRGRR